MKPINHDFKRRNQKAFKLYAHTRFPSFNRDSVPKATSHVFAYTSNKINNSKRHKSFFALRPTRDKRSFDRPWHFPYTATFFGLNIRSDLINPGRNCTFAIAVFAQFFLLIIQRGLVIN